MTTKVERLVMCDLVKKLDTKASMIDMGEVIAFGSDTELMREAARKIEAAQKREDDVKAAVKSAFGDTPVGVDGALLVPISRYNRLVALLNT